MRMAKQRLNITVSPSIADFLGRTDNSSQYIENAINLAIAMGCADAGDLERTLLGLRIAAGSETMKRGHRKPSETS